MRSEWRAHLGRLRTWLATRLRAVGLAYTGAGGVAAGTLVLAVLLTPLGATIQESVGEPLSRLFGLAGFPTLRVEATNPGQPEIDAGLVTATEGDGAVPGDTPAETAAGVAAPLTEGAPNTSTAGSGVDEAPAMPTVVEAMPVPAPAPTTVVPATTAAAVTATPTPGSGFGSLAMAATVDEGTEAAPGSAVQGSGTDVPTQATETNLMEPTVEVPSVSLPPTPTLVLVVPPTPKPLVPTPGPPVPTLEPLVPTLEPLAEVVEETTEPVVATTEPTVEPVVATVEATATSVIATAVPVVETAVPPVATAVQTVLEPTLVAPLLLTATPVPTATPTAPPAPTTAPPTSTPPPPTATPTPLLQVTVTVPDLP